MTRRRTVAVIGPGDTADDDLLATAEAVGAAVAAAGAVLVTGGLGGVMAAASRGAAAAGGLVVGVLPGDDSRDANDAVDVALATGLGQARNTVVVLSADAVVAGGGSWGTLAEVALARRAGRPVVSLHGWRVDGPAEPPLVATDPGEAVRLVLAAADRR